MFTSGTHVGHGLLEAHKSISSEGTEDKRLSRNKLFFDVILDDFQISSQMFSDFPSRL